MKLQTIRHLLHISSESSLTIGWDNTNIRVHNYSTRKRELI